MSIRTWNFIIFEAQNPFIDITQHIRVEQKHCANQGQGMLQKRKQEFDQDISTQWPSFFENYLEIFTIHKEV